MLHPKMFVLCATPSTIWAIVHVICLLSLLLRANLHAVFAKSFIYAQELFMLLGKIMWHCQIQLLTFTTELLFDMPLAWDPTFLKYPMK